MGSAFRLIDGYVAPVGARGASGESHEFVDEFGGGEVAGMQLGARGEFDDVEADDAPLFCDGAQGLQGGPPVETTASMAPAWCGA